MLYKNNARMSEQKQKYALRKLPIGVASVLLGTVAVGMGTVQTAHADTTTNNTASQQVAANKADGEKLTDKGANSQPTTNNTPQDKDISTTNTLNVNQANNNQKAVQKNVQNTAATLADNKVAATNNNQQNSNDNYDWSKAPLDQPINTNPNNQPWTNVEADKNVADVSDLTYKITQPLGTPADEANLTHLHLKFKVDASQLKSNNQIFLFRLNVSSNNHGMLGYNSAGGSNTNLFYYQGSPFGVLEGHAHALAGSNGAICDYIDYYLHVQKDLSKSLIGQQTFEFSSSDTPILLNGINNSSYPTMRYVPESKITYSAVAKGLSKPVTITYDCKWQDLAEYDNTNSQSYSPYIGEYGVSTVDANTIHFFINYMFTDHGQIKGDRAKGIVHVHSTNGNPIVLTNYGLKPGQSHTTSLNRYYAEISSNEKPVQIPQKGMQFAFLNSGVPTMPVKRVDNNTSADELKKMNFEGVVYSQQSDGSVIYAFNITKSMVQLTEADRDQIVPLLKKQSYWVNMNAKSPADLDKLANDEFTQLLKSQFQGVPQALNVYLGNDFNFKYDEPTTVNNDVYDYDNTDKLITSNSFSTTSATTLRRGQAGVNVHYISGANGMELSKPSQTVGDHNTDVKFSIPSVDTYHVRTGKDGQNTVTLLNGKTMTLPDGGTTISNNQGIKYPAESTVKDYYVVLDPASANETYQFVDDNNSGAKVGTPTTLNGYLNETKPLSLTVPAGYALAKGQTIPTNATLQNKTVLIHLVHKTTSVSRDVTVKRTVNYLEKGTNKELAKPVVQELTFKQVGVKDEVTGTTTWLTGDEEQSFDEVKSPEVDGYEAPSQASVESVNVKSDAKDQVVNVYYTKKATPAKPKAEVTNNQDHTPSAKVDKTKVTLPSNTSSALQQTPINTTNSSIVLPAKNNNNLAQTNTGADKNSAAIMGLALVGGTLILGSVKKRED